MATSVKLRDSHTILHFLRKNLIDPSKPPKIIHRSKEAIYDTYIAKKRKFSVADSSHYTDHSLKNMAFNFDHYLLDVEDMSKVYSKIREEIKVKRPQYQGGKIKTDETEFERRMKDDPLFRQKYFRNQEMLKHRQRRAQNLKVRFRGVSDDPKAKKALDETINSNIQNGFSYHQDELKDSSPVGKYKFRITKQYGNKMCYEILATAKKKNAMGELEDNILDSTKSRPVSQDGSIDRTLDQSYSKKRPSYFDINVDQANPFKKKDFYKPLSDSEIDVESRMKKRWNPPEFAKFTVGQVRKEQKNTELAFEELIDECEDKLVQNRANKAYIDYEKTQVDFENVLEKSFYNEKKEKDDLENPPPKEFVISLKDSTPIKPPAKLSTLTRKLYERKKLFGQTEGKTEIQRDLIRDIIIDIDDYENRKEEAAFLTALQKHQHKKSIMLSRKKGSTLISPRKVPNVPLSKAPSRILNPTIPESREKEDSQLSDTSGEVNLRAGKFQRSQGPRLTVGSQQPPKSRAGTRKATQSPMRAMHRLPSRINTGDEGNSSIWSGSPQLRPKTGKNPDDAFSFQLQRVDSRSPTEIPQNMSQFLADSSHNASKSNMILNLDPSPNSVNDPMVQKMGKKDVHNKKGSVLSSQYGGSSRFERNSQATTRADMEKLPPQFLTTLADFRKMNPKLLDFSLDDFEKSLHNTAQNFMKIKIEANKDFQIAIEALKKLRPLTNQIRYRNYDPNKMYTSHMEYFRGQAEKERLGRYVTNESQRQFYERMVDNVVRAELDEAKLQGCIYLFNALKVVLENGDYVDDEIFSKICDKIDNKEFKNDILITTIEDFMGLYGVSTDALNHPVLRAKVEAIREKKPDCSSASKSALKIKPTNSKVSFGDQEAANK